MKEIEFRGKIYKNEPFVYGNLIEYLTEEMEEIPKAFQYLMIPETIGQYTA